MEAVLRFLPPGMDGSDRVVVGCADATAGGLCTTYVVQPTRPSSYIKRHGYTRFLPVNLSCSTTRLNSLILIPLGDHFLFLTFLTFFLLLFSSFLSYFSVQELFFVLLLLFRNGYYLIGFGVFLFLI
ncbi:hypothetical protein F5Y03DRAFT_156326 [Xylaria venustula]|nr:hypothetical protein F5Y03DRAFT_156326 [Xylaria venustula]